MGVTSQILINRPLEGVHRAGRRVTGVVKYAIDEPTEYNEVILSLVGKGTVHWTEKDSSDDSKTRRYIGTEEYVSSHISILNKPHDQSFVLPAGASEYPFEFFLPQDIPPSFKNAHCNISYEIILKFHRPGLFNRNPTFVADVPVYGYVNHTVPDTPVVFGLEKSLFKPFSTGDQVVNLKAEIAKAFLTPGESAKVTATITNDSDVVVTSIRADVYSYTTYTANCGRRKHQAFRINGCTVETQRVECNTVGNVSMLVPTLPELYSIQHSSIMNKEYKIKLTVRLPLPHFNASVDMPIVIGERADAPNSFDMQMEAMGPGEQPPSYWESMSDEKEKE